MLFALNFLIQDLIEEARLSPWYRKKEQIITGSYIPSLGNRNIHGAVNTGINIWSRYGNDRKFCLFELRESTFTNLWMNAERFYSPKTNGTVKDWTTIVALQLQKSSDRCTCKN